MTAQMQFVPSSRINTAMQGSLLAHFSGATDIFERSLFTRLYVVNEVSVQLPNQP